VTITVLVRLRTPDRRLLLFFVPAAIILGQNASPPPPPPDQDPFVGAWRANEAKSRPKLNRTERSYTRTIERSGDDLVFSSTGGASKALVRQFSIRCDGLRHTLPAGAFLSCTYTAPDRVEGETLGPNRKLSYWARQVSPDGQLMTIFEYKDKARTKINSVMVLDRLK